MTEFDIARRMEQIKASRAAAKEASKRAQVKQAEAAADAIREQQEKEYDRNAAAKKITEFADRYIDWVGVQRLSSAINRRSITKKVEFRPSNVHKLTGGILDWGSYWITETCTVLPILGTTETEWIKEEDIRGWGEVIDTKTHLMSASSGFHISQQGSSKGIFLEDGSSGQIPQTKIRPDGLGILIPFDFRNTHLGYEELQSLDSTAIYPIVIDTVLNRVAELTLDRNLDPEAF